MAKKENEVKNSIENTNCEQQIIMIKDQDEEESTVNVWQRYVKHWKMILAIIIICVGLGFVYNQAFKKKTWNSTGKAGVATDKGYSTSLNDDLAKDVMNSDFVYSSIAETLNKDKKPAWVNEKVGTKGIKDEWKNVYTVSSLKKLVSARTEKSTPMVFVTAKTSDADFSKFLVNNMLRFGQQHSKENENLKIMFGENVKIISDAGTTTIETKKSSKILLVSVAGGIVLSILYAFVFEASNPHFSSSVEVENETGYKIIGLVPEVENVSKSKKEGK